MKTNIFCSAAAAVPISRPSIAPDHGAWRRCALCRSTCQQSGCSRCHRPSSAPQLRSPSFPNQGRWHAASPVDHAQASMPRSTIACKTMVWKALKMDGKSNGLEIWVVPNHLEREISRDVEMRGWSVLYGGWNVDKGIFTRWTKSMYT
jgi:hypothetical protein